MGYQGGIGWAEHKREMRKNRLSSRNSHIFMHFHSNKIRRHQYTGINWKVKQGSINNNYKQVISAKKSPKHKELQCRFLIEEIAMARHEMQQKIDVGIDKASKSVSLYI